jgi:hypothetical protein
MSEDKKEIDQISLFFEIEYRNFKYDRKSWLKYMKKGVSQFSGEVNPEPDKTTLKSLGKLIWCSSIFEEKLSRAIFWLSSLVEGKLVDLPGQSTKVISRLGKLNKLLNMENVSDIIGLHTVEWTRELMRGIRESITFRDDMVHGHHQGNWYKGNVLRVPGKTFSKANARFTKADAPSCNAHATKFLEAAALLALYDDIFYDLEDKNDLIKLFSDY